MIKIARATMLSQNGRKLLAVVMMISLLCLLVNGERKFANSDKQLEEGEDKEEKVPVKKIREVVIVELPQVDQDSPVGSNDPIKSMGFDNELLRKRRRFATESASTEYQNGRESEDETDAATTDDGLTSGDESSDNELALSENNVRRKIKKRRSRRDAGAKDSDLSNSDASNDDDDTLNAGQSSLDDSDDASYTTTDGSSLASDDTESDSIYSSSDDEERTTARIARITKYRPAGRVITSSSGREFGR